MDYDFDIDWDDLAVACALAEEMTDDEKERFLLEAEYLLDDNEILDNDD